MPAETIAASEGGHFKPVMRWGCEGSRVSAGTSWVTIEHQSGVIRLRGGAQLADLCALLDRFLACYSEKGGDTGGVSIDGTVGDRNWRVAHRPAVQYGATPLTWLQCERVAVGWSINHLSELARWLYRQTGMPDRLKPDDQLSGIAISREIGGVGVTLRDGSDEYRTVIDDGLSRELASRILDIASGALPPQPNQEFFTLQRGPISVMAVHVGNVLYGIGLRVNREYRGGIMLDLPDIVTFARLLLETAAPTGEDYVRPHSPHDHLATGSDRPACQQPLDHLPRRRIGTHPAAPVW